MKGFCEGYNFQFNYWSRKKSRAIQFKPNHDAENHFTILRVDKKEFSAQDFHQVDALIRAYIREHNYQLLFTVLRVCSNCTYGRFEPDFEKLIYEIRKTYKGVSAAKDLTLDDPKHVELKEMVLWNEEYPIIHHIHGRGTLEWEEAFRGTFDSEGFNNKLFGSRVILRFNKEEFEAEQINGN